MRINHTLLRFCIGVLLVVAAFSAVRWWQAEQKQAITANAPTPQEEESLSWQESTPLTAYSDLLRPLEEAWRKHVAKARQQNTLASGVNFTLSARGHKTWVFTVKQVAFEDASQLNEAHLKGVQGQLVNTQGQPVATFSAPYGLYHQQKKRLDLYGRVTFLHF